MKTGPKTLPIAADTRRSRPGHLSDPVSPSDHAPDGPAHPVDAVVCTAGSGVNALAILRSLGRIGLRVAVLAEEDSNLAIRSRYCSQALVRKPWTSAELSQALADVASRQQARPLLFIDNDRMIALLAPHGDTLQRKFHLTAPLDSENRINDKSFQLERARELGVPAPRHWQLRSWADLENLSNEVVGFGLLAKPASASPDTEAVFKVVKGNDVGELLHSMKSFLASPDGCVVQEFVPGPVENLRWAMGYRSVDGECVVATGLKQRQTGSGAGGVGSVMLACEDATVEAHARRYVDGAGYVGMFGIEFKYSDADGRLYFIEINARSEAFHALGRKIGVDLPVLAYRDLVEGVPPAARSLGSPPEVYWIAFGMDVATLFRGRTESTLASIMRPYLSRKQWSVHDWSDPAPWCYASFAFASDAGARLTGRFVRSLRRLGSGGNVAETPEHAPDPANRG